MSQQKFSKLAVEIKQWASDLGFHHTGISDIDLSEAERNLSAWLKKKFHGEMDYMHKHGHKRTRPELLVPDTIRIISVRLDYLPESMSAADSVLGDSEKGYVSRYALGRDYHKLIRKRLKKLADRIDQQVEEFGYRVFCDSAPVMEKAIAVKAGQGWLGKHTNVLNRHHGSWFFLGELYTNIPLPLDQAVTAHCGSCRACIDICPTQAIVQPYVLDARRCISYLTIEHHGSIPVEFRKPMGNRIYGCDDCQLVCPWNKYAKISAEPDFKARHQLDRTTLVDLFKWTESDFLSNTEGSAIRRIGHQRWLRNIAVALGNAEHSETTVDSLKSAQNHDSQMVREHVRWALDQQQQKSQTT